MCHYYDSHKNEQQATALLWEKGRRDQADTYTHFSESGRMAPNCILLRATSKGYLNSWKHAKCGCSQRNRGQPANNNQPKLVGFPDSGTYDIVCAMAPATPPQSRLMWGFRIRTLGLSDDGRPRCSGKCLRPRLFSVPKVKNENPGERREVHIQSGCWGDNAAKRRFSVSAKSTPKLPLVTCIRSHSNKCWSEPPVEAKNTPFLWPKEEFMVWKAGTPYNYLPFHICNCGQALPEGRWCGRHWQCQCSDALLSPGRPA